MGRAGESDGTTLRDEAMPATDAFAWNMERDPVLRSTVVAVIRLAGVPEWSLLRARIDRLTRTNPRLRMRVRETPLRLLPPRWDAAEFDLDFHLRRLRVPAGGDWDAVLDFARTAAMADFDRARPLWEFTVLEGLDDNGAAFVTKIHHSLADGIGGVQLSAQVLDPESAAAGTTTLGPEPVGDPASSLAVAAHSVQDLEVGGARVVIRGARRLPHAVAYGTRHPLQAAVDGVRASVSVGRMVRPIFRAESPIFEARRSSRRLLTFDVPFAGLHDVARQVGCHVNDAYLAGLIDGLRRYHEKAGAAPDHLRVTVPISQRSSDDAAGGNRITLVRIRGTGGGDGPEGAHPRDGARDGSLACGAGARAHAGHRRRAQPAAAPLSR